MMEMIKMIVLVKMVESVDEEEVVIKQKYANKFKKIWGSMTEAEKIMFTNLLSN